MALIDVGGTNCRAALLQQTERELALVGDPVTAALPVRGAEPLDARTFFDFQAALLAKLVDEPDLPLGYCFSYPAEVQPDLDARLIGWTKGIDLPEVVGRPVGALLADALARRGIAPKRVVVLNDTVASLLGASKVFHGPARLTAGLIAGTGTNMAGFFAAEQAPKLRGFDGPMALNLESGNYAPPAGLLTPADRAIDQREHPGCQLFEKAVSGHYLPLLFAELRTEQLQRVDPVAGSERLAQLANDPSAPTEAQRLASALLHRSADMVAAGLAALLDHYPPGQVGILAEGSLFWCTPGYAERVQRSLATLVGAPRFTLLRLQHANLYGAAMAALAS